MAVDGIRWTCVKWCGDEPNQERTNVMLIETAVQQLRRMAETIQVGAEVTGGKAVRVMYHQPLDNLAALQVAIDALTDNGAVDRVASQRQWEEFLRAGAMPVITGSQDKRDELLRVTQANLEAGLF